MTLLTFEPGTTQINSESFVTVLRQHVWFCILIGQGRPTYGTREHFLGTRHSLLFQIFLFLLYYQLPYIVKKMYVRACVYIYIYIYIYIYKICLNSTYLSPYNRILASKISRSSFRATFLVNNDRLGLHLYFWGRVSKFSILFEEILSLLMGILSRKIGSCSIP